VTQDALANRQLTANLGKGGCTTSTTLTASRYVSLAFLQNTENHARRDSACSDPRLLRSTPAQIHACSDPRLLRSTPAQCVWRGEDCKVLSSPHFCVRLCLLLTRVTALAFHARGFPLHRYPVKDLTGCPTLVIVDRCTARLYQADPHSQARDNLPTFTAVFSSAFLVPLLSLICCCTFVGLFTSMYKLHDALTAMPWLILAMSRLGMSNP
jgi:hypothetical protein